MICKVSPQAIKQIKAAGLYLKVMKRINSLAVLIVQPSLKTRLEAYRLLLVTVSLQVLAFLHGFNNAKMRSKDLTIVMIR